MRRYLPLLLCVFAFPGFSPDTPRTAQQPSWRGATEFANGVSVVRNPSRPLYPRRRIIFEEDLTIGVEDGDENDMFGSQVALNADEDGFIYITDQDKRIVKKYDADGSFIQTIGRPGQGPGEYGKIGEARFDDQGNIYLNDLGNQRITFLSRQGEYIKSIKTPPAFERVIINTKGYYIAKHFELVELGKSKKWDEIYGLFDDQFKLAAEFLRLPQEARAQAKNNSPAQVFADFLSGTAFQPSGNFVLDKRDRVYFGYPETYEIKVFTAEGTLQALFQRDYNPVKIDNRHKDHFKSGLDRTLLVKMPAAEEKTIFKLIKYPKYKPAYERLTLMENGWIFVLVDSVSDENRLVDIFSRDGKFLAQFKTNIATDQLFFKNGKAYAVATLDDYKFIKRYHFKILD